jgi:DNA-binding transcriptional MerR regulator
MKYENLILISEVCRHYHLDPSFFELLDEHGLLDMIYQEPEYYLEMDHLPRLEKIIRFQSDLNINLEGVGVIMELLERIERLQEENQRLRNRLGLFDF